MGSFDRPPQSPGQHGFHSLQQWTRESLSQGNDHDYSHDSYHEEETKGTKILTTRVSEYDHEVQEQQPRPSVPELSRFARMMEKFWIFEVVALIVSSLGLVGIVAILAVTDEKKIPDWQVRTKYTKPLAVTLNSVISLFSTLVKSTVLIPVVASLGELKWLWFGDEHPLNDVQVFDGAAKGPLGAAIMLWSFRGRTLACLGAIITIGSLGLDFGFQQLVTYPLRPVNVGPSYIARTDFYDAARPNSIPGAFLPELPMQGAIWKGIYGIGDLFYVTPTCATGNCTWEDYTSLTVRSKCYSTTDQLQKYCSTSDSDGFSIPYCTYTLPSGQNISSLDASSATILNIAGIPASNDTYFGKAPSGRIATMSVVRSDWEHVADGDNSYFAIKSANATECGLEVVVTKFHGSVVKGVFQEQSVDVFANTTQLDEMYWYPTQYTGLAPDSVYLTPPASWFAQSEKQGTNTFIMDISAISGLRAQFAGGVMWSGTFETTLQEDDAGTPTNDLVNWIRNLDDGGVNGTMEALAASMTNRIRLSASDGNAHNASFDAIGTTSQWVPFVHVRWGWIALPASILFLSCVFLAATMIEAKRKGATMLWKSNGLAQFYHPLTKEGREKIRVAGSAKQALKIAEDMKVRWHETEAGGRFIISG